MLCLLTAMFFCVNISGVYSEALVRSLVVSDLHSETKGSRFVNGC